MSRHAWISTIVFSAIMWGLIFWAASCNAAIDDDNAVLAIIGEAEGEPYIGKYYIACAIRNRGTLHGVYGVNSSRVKNHAYSDKTLNDAKRAWIESEHNTKITSTHWGGNVVDEGWINKARKSGKFSNFITVGGQTFFTEI